MTEFVANIDKMLKKNKKIEKFPYIGIVKCGKNIYNANKARYTLLFYTNMGGKKSEQA